MWSCGPVAVKMERGRANGNKEDQERSLLSSVEAGQERTAKGAALASWLICLSSLHIVDQTTSITQS